MKTALFFILVFIMMVPLAAQPNLKWQERLMTLPTLKAKYNQGSFPGKETARSAKTHQLDSVILKTPAENSSNLIDRIRSTYQYTSLEQFESETSEVYDEQLYSWENDSRNSYIYDVKGQLFLESSFNWDQEQGEWINGWKSEYVYGQKDQIISESSYYWHEEISDWQGNSQRIYMYDTSGLMTSEIFNGWDSFNGWYEISKYEYKYSANGKLEEEIYSQKESPDAAWRQTDSTKFTFDSLDRLIFITHYNSYETDIWQLNFRYKLTYDTFSKVIEELGEHWNALEQNWIPSQVYTYSYDSEGHQTSQYIYNWDITAQYWEGFYGTTTVYNEFGDYTEIVDLKWDELKQEWLPSFKYEYGYDLSVPFENVLWPYRPEDGYAVFNRMPLYVNDYDFEDVWELVFSGVLRYSFRTSAKDLLITPLSISPNPANDYIRVTLPESELETNIEMHSIDGKKVSSAYGWDSSSISVQSLASGIYTVRIQNGNTIYQGKFVKE